MASWLLAFAAFGFRGLCRFSSWHLRAEFPSCGVAYEFILGSSLSIRSCAQLGLRASVSDNLRVAGNFSALEEGILGNNLSLHRFTRLCSSLSTSARTRVLGQDLSVGEAAQLTSSLSTLNFVCIDQAVSPVCEGIVGS